MLPIDFSAAKNEWKACTITSRVHGIDKECFPMIFM